MVNPIWQIDGKSFIEMEKSLQLHIEDFTTIDRWTIFFTNKPLLDSLV